MKASTLTATTLLATLLVTAPNNTAALDGAGSARHPSATVTQMPAHATHRVSGGNGKRPEHWRRIDLPKPHSLSRRLAAHRPRTKT